MKNSVEVSIELNEVCDAVGISTETLVQIVEHGIVQPESPQQPWCFSVEALPLIKRASRLKYDLDIDWPGIALAIDILCELDDLRAENSRLKQRLERFLEQ